MWSAVTGLYFFAFPWLWLDGPAFEVELLLELAVVPGLLSGRDIFVRGDASVVSTGPDALSRDGAGLLIPDGPGCGDRFPALAMFICVPPGPGIVGGSIGPKG